VTSSKRRAACSLEEAKYPSSSITRACPHERNPIQESKRVEKRKDKAP